MKVTKINTEVPERQLMALVGTFGFYFKSGRGCVCISGSGHSYIDRSLSSVAQENPSLPKVYEGESITITF